MTRTALSCKKLDIEKVDYNEIDYAVRVKVTVNIITIKGFNFAVLKVRGFLNGDLSQWFKFRGFGILRCTCSHR